MRRGYAGQRPGRSDGSRVARGDHHGRGPASLVESGSRGIREGRITPIDKLRKLAEDVDAQTPEERDRYADLIRVLAILVVVLGHWIAAVVIVDDGEVDATQILVVEPWTQLATWVVQVMPLFFLVGGLVNADSLRRARERGQSSSAWIQKRARRLLLPTLPLLVLWLAMGPAMSWMGVEAGLVELATESAFVPLWFLVVYLLVIVLAPASMWLHRRAGVPLILGAVVLVGVVDALERAEVPIVGELNYLLVFGIAHQLGYLWADGRLPGWPRSLHLAWGGFGAAVLLVWLLDYPVSMVGLLADADSNATPPTLAMVALTIMQVGIVLSLRGRADRWLHRRPVVWVGVAVIGSVIITIFLWHMTALIVVASLTHVVGWWPQTTEIDAQWWLLRPVWLTLCGLALIPLVLIFRKLESAGEPGPGGALRTALGIAATAGGLYILLTEGVYDPDRLAGIPLATVPLLAAGMVLLKVVTRSSLGSSNDP